MVETTEQMIAAKTPTTFTMPSTTLELSKIKFPS